MVIKFITAGIVLSVITLFFLGLESASAPLFIIISNNPVVILARSLITLAAVVIAFRGQFAYEASRKLSGWLGALLVGFGIAGFFSHDLAFAIDSYIMPYDYLLLFELGVVFLLATLTYQPGQRNLNFYKFYTRLRHTGRLKIEFSESQRKNQKSAL